MVHLPALPMKFKAEHVDPLGGKPCSTNSCCQSVAEQAVVWHSFSTDSWKTMLERSRMPITNEQTHKNRNYTLNVKCKIRILITIAEYVDGKANIDVKLDFEKSDAES